MTTCTKKLNGEFRPIKYSQADRGAEGITLFAFEASSPNHHVSFVSWRNHFAEQQTPSAFNSQIHDLSYSQQTHPSNPASNLAYKPILYPPIVGRNLYLGGEYG